MPDEKLPQAVVTLLEYVDHEGPVPVNDVADLVDLTDPVQRSAWVRSQVDDLVALRPAQDGQCYAVLTDRGAQALHQHRRRERRREHWNAAPSGDVQRPDDLIPKAVALSLFHLTEKTLRRAVKDGRITSYRPAGGPANAAHLYSEAALAKHFSRKTGQR